MKDEYTVKVQIIKNDQLMSGLGKITQSKEEAIKLWNTLYNIIDLLIDREVK